MGWTGVRCLSCLASGSGQWGLYIITVKVWVSSAGVYGSPNVSLWPDLWSGQVIYR